MKNHVLENGNFKPNAGLVYAHLVSITESLPLNSFGICHWRGSVVVVGDLIHRCKSPFPPLTELNKPTAEMTKGSARESQARLPPSSSVKLGCAA